MIDHIETIAANIKLLVLDVDGVLTNGLITYNHLGQELKSFHAQDGYGIKQLQSSGIHVGIISGRDCPALRHRIQELNICDYFLNCHDKVPKFKQLLEKLQLTPAQTAYMGDDAQDIPVLKMASLKATVADGHPSLKPHVNFITKRPGGFGAVRELCDFILAQQPHNR